MLKVKVGFLRVLIVDDSRVSRTVMHELLKESGFNHIDEAENATEAYDKMEALRYDVVFLDWVMPGRSGVSLMEEWRADRRYDDVAVIVASMQNNKSMITGALKAGALDYIVKPVTEDLLQKCIKKTLGWLELRREFREEQNS